MTLRRIAVDSKSHWVTFTESMHPFADNHPFFREKFRPDQVSSIAQTL
jgi:hypothetical protein